MRNVTMLMRVMAVVAGSLLLSGTFMACSGLRATKPTELAINLDVNRMSQPAVDANEAMAFDANRFAYYADTATVNLWTYWTKPAKTILCTAAIYDTLQQKADRSAEHAFRVRASACAASQPAIEPATQPAGPSVSSGQASQPACPDVITPAQVEIWRTFHQAWIATIKREMDGN